MATLLILPWHNAWHLTRHFTLNVVRSTMEPIATYFEQRFDGKRMFTLFPDAIDVRGSVALTSEFELRIPLSSLDPNYTKLRCRNRGFNGGMWMLSASIFACTVLVSGFQLPWISASTGLATCMGMAGLLLSLATCRKVEFVQFRSQAGVTALDLARSGPQRDQLDGFVETLVRQIGVTRGAK